MNVIFLFICIMHVHKCLIILYVSPQQQQGELDNVFCAVQQNYDAVNCKKIETYFTKNEQKTKESIHKTSFQVFL